MLNFTEEDKQAFLEEAKNNKTIADQNNLIYMYYMLFNKSIHYYKAILSSHKLYIKKELK
jgi:hypothetical protein